jgi:hypothetical protein
MSINETGTIFNYAPAIIRGRCAVVLKISRSWPTRKPTRWRYCFLDRGGVFRSDWRAGAVAVHHACVARRLSPGGSADMLAAAWFVHSLRHRSERS